MNTLSKKLAIILVLSASPLINNFVYAEGELPALYQAIQTNDHQKIEKLMNEGASANEFIIQTPPTKDKNSNLVAIPDPNLIIYRGGYPASFSLLHLAIDRKHTDVAKKLIELGADVEAKDSFNNTPLDLALKNQTNTQLIDLIIEKIENLDSINSLFERYTREKFSLEDKQREIQQELETVNKALFKIMTQKNMLEGHPSRVIMLPYNPPKGERDIFEFFKRKH